MTTNHQRNLILLTAIIVLILCCNIAYGQTNTKTTTTTTTKPSSNSTTTSSIQTTTTTFSTIPTTSSNTLTRSTTTATGTTTLYSTTATNILLAANSNPAKTDQLFTFAGYLPMGIGGFVFVIMLYSFFFGALARQRYRSPRSDVLVKTSILERSTNSKSKLSKLGYGIPGMKPSNSALVSPMNSQRRRRAPRERANNQVNAKMLDALASVEQGLSIPGFLQFEKDKDFRSEKYLTSGGSGQIFIGTALNPEIAKFGKQVIVKEFNSMKSSSDKDSFFQEVSIMYLLRDHKNIAKIAGFSSEPTFALVLKYYPLGSMQSWISKGPKQATKHKGLILALIQDICDGIMFMHMHGLAHADLKPSNVLLDVDSRKNLFGVLSDFGITRIVDENILKVKHFHTVEVNGASRPYAAPETLTQLRKKGPSSMDYLKADIYSLATIFYQMLTRRSPWSSKS